jgi:hypothetical protein
MQKDIKPYTDSIAPDFNANMVPYSRRYATFQFADVKIILPRYSVIVSNPT